MTGKPSNRTHGEEAAIMLHRANMLAPHVKQWTEPGAIIDREAVAPAVRELVTALQRATQSLPHGKNYEGPFKASSAALADTEIVWAAYARYRHLIEESDQ